MEILGRALGPLEIIGQLLGTQEMLGMDKDYQKGHKILRVAALVSRAAWAGGAPVVTALGSRGLGTFITDTLTNQ